MPAELEHYRESIKREHPGMAKSRTYAIAVSSFKRSHGIRGKTTEGEMARVAKEAAAAAPAYGMGRGGGMGMGRQDAHNSPSFAYKAVHGKEKFLPGRSGHPQKLWKGIPVDTHMPTKVLDELAAIPGVNARSSCEGHDAERGAYLVFRLDSDKDAKAWDVSKKLREQGVYSLADYGRGEGRPRIVAAAGVSHGEKSWKSWWNALPNKIRTAVRGINSEKEKTAGPIANWAIRKAKETLKKKEKEAVMDKLSQRGWGRPGLGGGPFAAGPGGACQCPDCGHEEAQARAQPCRERVCPECGAKMVRKGFEKKSAFEYGFFDELEKVGKETYMPTTVKHPALAGLVPWGPLQAKGMIAAKGRKALEKSPWSVRHPVLNPLLTGLGGGAAGALAGAGIGALAGGSEGASIGAGLGGQLGALSGGVGGAIYGASKAKKRIQELNR